MHLFLSCATEVRGENIPGIGHQKASSEVHVHDFGLWEEKENYNNYLEKTR